MSQPRTTYLLAAIVSFFIGIFTATGAFGQQLAVLKKIPPELLRYTGGARPDAEGLVEDNRGGFRSPEFQRKALWRMIRGIVAGNPTVVEDGWRAIDATFRHQSPDGSFSQAGSPHGGPSAAALFLADLSEAMLILQESRLATMYQERIAQLRPKLHRTARWLALPKNQQRLLQHDSDAPNRLLFGALAFGLAGKLTADKELEQIGRRFVDLAMAKYRPRDGVFLEKGGHDSSYQAVAAMKLLVWTIHFPDEKLQSASHKAICWLRERIDAQGQVDVSGNTRTGLGQERWRERPKEVNLSEITLALLYHYALTGDNDSLAAARRVVEARRAKETVGKAED